MPRPSHDGAVAGPSVLAINSGSSSLKFGVFTLALPPLRLGGGAAASGASDAVLAEVARQVAAHVAAHPLAAIGHRIVHGGPQVTTERRLSPEVIDTLRRAIPFAPNHLPAEIALIEAAARMWPDLPQFICVDTAFHTQLPEVARRLPIPAEYAARGIRRYGFHGLSYTFLLDELARRAGTSHARGKVVLMHLGNGSSVAAVDEGCCVDTSMGFTPIGGVVMSTRSGDLDPGVVTHIARITGADADRVEHELSHRAGLAGLSGGTSDMRELLAREEGDDACRLAVAIYCREITKRIGAYAAVLGGLDTLVFSGGIGEHAPVIRERICAGLGFLGVHLDAAANRAQAAVISTPGAPVTVHVIATDEETVIAAAATRLLA